MPFADKDFTYVYLSNIEDIPFERSYMVAVLSTLDFHLDGAILLSGGNLNEI